MGKLFVFVSSLLLLTLFFSVTDVEARLGCKNGANCLSSETMFKNGKVLAKEEGDLFGSGLRLVPSGPDPLHHNGSPRKPQTP